MYYFYFVLIHFFVSSTLVIWQWHFSVFSIRLLRICTHFKNLLYSKLLFAFGKCHISKNLSTTMPAWSSMLIFHLLCCWSMLTEWKKIFQLIQKIRYKTWWDFRTKVLQWFVFLCTCCCHKFVYFWTETELLWGHS